VRPRWKNGYEHGNEKVLVFVRDLASAQPAAQASAVMPDEGLTRRGIERSGLPSFTLEARFRNIGFSEKSVRLLSLGKVQAWDAIAPLASLPTALSQGEASRRGLMLSSDPGRRWPAGPAAARLKTNAGNFRGAAGRHAAQPVRLR